MSRPQTFKEILDRPSFNQNGWIRSHGIDVYVRVGRVMICKDYPRKTLTVANLTSTKPGRGKLGLVYDELEVAARAGDVDGVYVENVINERLASWLERRGYKLMGKHNILPCYWSPTP